MSSSPKDVQVGAYETVGRRTEIGRRGGEPTSACRQIWEGSECVSPLCTLLLRCMAPSIIDLPSTNSLLG